MVRFAEMGGDYAKQIAFTALEWRGDHGADVLLEQRDPRLASLENWAGQDVFNHDPRANAHCHCRPSSSIALDLFEELQKRLPETALRNDPEALRSRLKQLHRALLGTGDADRSLDDLFKTGSEFRIFAHQLIAELVKPHHV